METDQLLHQCSNDLHRLCSAIQDRSVGSAGNREATRFFAGAMARLGWQVETQVFDAVDWEAGSATLQIGDQRFEVLPSPYSLGCDVTAPLLSVSSLDELAQAQLDGKIVLLHGEIAREQIMPKNFVFYNPEEHQQIVALLEQGQPQALICATGRNAALAGGVYPFPLFEDGDFEIPSVYMTEEEGRRLLPFAGQAAVLKNSSRRIPGQGENITARKGSAAGGRVVVTAHIDAKKGTPGAIDNASGVVVLLLLANLLHSVSGKQVEIVALNGEDYYAVPGQMLYVQNNQDRFDEILLNINIDGAGYLEGPSAFSFYGLPQDMESQARAVFDRFNGIIEGAQWPQGDHSIFIQHGRPAVALSSAWFTENIDSQEITHTPKDRIEIVDCRKLVEIAQALAQFIAEYQPDLPVGGSSL